ncbi:LacI family DNA-binding transcriptional regulator [Streptomyces sp. cg35]|uniref:LacI family DNA-binding transcriptional regulator n=1 Tax=Streptomyces sp. cg35 TaxID=3421650 RepID=UPI003D186A4F
MKDRARRTARIQEVAAAAGVSVATVSNVLNRPERVTAATTERVMAAVAALDYVPHSGASNLRSGRGSAVGLVLPDVVNSFYARIAAGAADAAYERGYALTLCHSGDDAERERGYFDMLADQRAVGAVVVPLGADRTRLARLRRRGLPLVTADRADPDGDGCSVSVDDVQGGAEAVEHLIAGRPATSTDAMSIVVVNGDPDIQQCADRATGAEIAAGRHPSVELTHIAVDEMTVAAGRAAAHTLVTGPRLPDAVFCANDFLAAGLVRGLVVKGVRVPEDVRVVGFGDLDVAAFSTVPLSTVRQPVEELGRTAVELLLDEVESGGGHQHLARILTPTMVVRESAP